MSDTPTPDLPDEWISDLPEWQQRFVDAAMRGEQMVLINPRRYRRDDLYYHLVERLDGEL